MAVKTIEWKNDRVIMLDQRLLPHKEVYRVCRDYKEVAQAIRDMTIRGAPAIGVAAAGQLVHLGRVNWHSHCQFVPLFRPWSSECAGLE